MASVGYATLSIVPSVRGMAGELNKQLRQAGVRPAETAGTQIGASLVRGINRSFGRIVRNFQDTSRRMAATFVGATNPITRGLANFRAGFMDASAAASAFTGRMGALGGLARSALNPAINAVGRFRDGFMSSTAAMSDLTGRLGTMGGLARRALDSVVTGAQNVHAGFMSSDAAASAFTGRLGSLGGLARSAVQPVLTGAQNVAAGFLDSDAAASAFTGRLGTVGGLARSAVQPAVTGAQNLAAGFLDSSAAASTFTGRLGTIGGAARNAIQPAVTGVQNLHSGFLSSGAAASAFTGRMGTLGGIARTALQPAVTAVGAVGRGMATVGTAATSAFGVVRTGAGAAFGALRTAGTTAFSAVRSGVASMAASAQNNVGGIGSALTRMGAVGSAAVSAIGLAGLGRTALSTAADIQQATASMSGLYGSTELADDMMRRLRDYARDTPLETQSLYDAGSNLAYLGLQGEDAMGVIENVGTALMASGNTSEQAMGNVTSALLSMQSAGQLYAGDIQKVSNEMVPAWDMLAEHMGMSIADVRAEVTAGNLAVDDFVAALQAGDGDYFAMMQESAEETNQTFKAQFAQVKDNVRMALGETLLPLVDRAAPAMGRLGDSIEDGLNALPGIMSGIAGTLRDAGVVDGFRALVDGARDFGSAAMPALRSFGEVVGGAFLGVLQVMRPLGDLLSRMAGWMRENEGATRLLGAVLGGLVVGIVAVRTATTLWAVATGVLNAVMSANPIGLIVIAIAALVAGIVYAYRNFEGFRNVVDTVWQAIRTAAMWIWERGLKPAFEGIRDGVQWVGDAVMWLWESAIKPAWDAIVDAFEATRSGAGSALEWIQDALKAVGDAALWLWESAIKPAFDFIWSLIKNVVTAIIVVAIAPLVLAFKLIAATATWLWDAVLKPVFNWIGDAAVWLWENAIKPAWDGIVAGLQVLGDWFTWLWDNAIKPAFDFIAAGATWLWENAIKPTWDALVAGIGLVADWFSWLWTQIRNVFNWIAGHISNWWNTARDLFNTVIDFVRGALSTAFTWFRDNVIQPVWDWISDKISSVWENGIKPTFDKVMEGVDWLKDAFEAGKDAISDAWEGIRDSAKDPVNFLIDTVYNDGIRPLWNRVAGIVGADELGRASGFATGGPVYGAGTTTSDSIPALLSNNEHVWTAREVSAAGGHGAVEAIRQQALAGGTAYRAGGQVAFPGAPRIPSGKRILDAVADFISPSSMFALGGDIISGDTDAAVDRVFKPAREITGEIGTSGLPGTPHLIVKKGGDLIKSKIKDLVAAWNASFGGGGGGSDVWVGLASASERLQRAARWADTQHGLPYQWGGGGNPSWDCSGFMAGIENVIRGISPGRRYTTHNFYPGSNPPAGWVRGLNSPFTVGVQTGHMSGTLLGKNVESAGGGKGVVTGSRARGTGSYPWRFGFAPVVGEVGGSGSSTGAGSRMPGTPFDDGGLLKPGLQLVYNGTGKPETVRTAAQEARVERLVEAMERGGVGNVINVQPPPATVSELVDGVSYSLRRARRGGVHAGVR